LSFVAHLVGSKPSKLVSILLYIALDCLQVYKSKW
jgi:hypothetical protein